MYQVSEAVLEHVGWDAAKEAALQQLLPLGSNAQDGWQESSWSWLQDSAVNEAARSRKPLNCDVAYSWLSCLVSELMHEQIRI